MLFQTAELMERGRAGEMGSGFWPMLLLAVAAFLSVCLFVSKLKKFISLKKTQEPEGTPADNRKARATARTKVTLCAIAMLVYITLLPLVGFPLSTCLYTLVCMWALEERRKWVLVGSPILITALILVVFARFITMPLPKGVGIFADFSRLFY